MIAGMSRDAKGIIKTHLSGFTSFCIIVRTNISNRESRERKTNHRSRPYERLFCIAACKTHGGLIDRTRSSREERRTRSAHIRRGRRCGEGWVLRFGRSRASGRAREDRVAYIRVHEVRRRDQGRVRRVKRTSGRTQGGRCARSVHVRGTRPRDRDRERRVGHDRDAGTGARPRD
jgi:hypothetical protein